MSIPVGTQYRGRDGRLGYLLRQAYQSMRGQISAAALQHGVTAPQFSVMSVLEHEPGLSGAGVARQSMLRAQSANEIIQRLARDGYIKRTPDPADRRRHVIHLTARGQQVLDLVNQDVAVLEERVLAELTPQVRSGLLDGLVACARLYSSDGISADDRA